MSADLSRRLCICILSAWCWNGAADIQAQQMRLEPRATMLHPSPAETVGSERTIMRAQGGADLGPPLQNATRREITPQNTDSPTAAKKGSGMATWSSMAGSLAMVLAVFGICVYFLKRSGAAKGRNLQKGVFEVLGGSALTPRHQALLVRCGERVLLISVGPNGGNTLAEFTDSAEVNRLIASCRSGESGNFQETLQQIGSQRHAGGFVASSANLFG